MMPAVRERRPERRRITEGAESIPRMQSVTGKVTVIPFPTCTVVQWVWLWLASSGYSSGYI